MSELIRTRFAPSPTGRMHLGNVRTALFNALAARAGGGAFILRVEDTDAARSRAEWSDKLLRDLRWLGLRWSEGPDINGPHGPYRQAARDEIYNTYFERLIVDGHAYPCFCTPEELARARQSQLAAGQAPRYPGTCATLTARQVEKRRAAGEPEALRFGVPAAARIDFDDVVRGTQHFDSAAIGDFVIRRANGTPSFFFSNALDDALMEVTLVLRGEDHLSNTPRQLMLLEALGLSAPRYGHLALLVGDDNAPLSKRHGSASLDDLRAEGFLPGAVNNYLARLGHHYPNDPGYADDATLAARFDLAHLGTSGAHFDRGQLRHWQKEAVSHANDEALWSWLVSADIGIDALVPSESAAAFVWTVRDNIVLPDDAAAWARSLYAEDDYMSEAAGEVVKEAGPAFFATALKAFDADVEFKAWVKRVGADLGVKGKALYMPLRAALTGQTHGPELVRVKMLLGSDRIRARLEGARQSARG